MKISSVAVLAISCMPSTVAFVANTQKSVTPTQLNLNDKDGNNESWDRMVGPAMAGLVGLTLASQMAVAATLDPSSIVSMSPEIDATPIVLREDSTTKLRMTQIENAPVSAISGSSIQLADDYLSLDMPSYGDAVTSTSKAKSSDGGSGPLFSNPFGGNSDSSDAPDTSTEDKAAVDAAKQAKKEAAAQEREEAAQRKEAKKAALDADKAEKEQAAAEKKAADEVKVAQKKAEKEARREAEKEKQRLAVESANAIKDEKAAAAPAENYSLPEVKIPEFKAPDFKAPEFKAPDFKVPDFKVPEFKAPDFKTPDFKAPEFKAPDFKTPDFKAPDVKAPEFKAPEFKAPDIKMPEFKAPSFSVPKMPDMPSVSTPSFSVPTTPKVSTPSYSSSSSSGGYASLDENIVDDQEERDEKAKVARTAFNEVDANAREVENQAKKLRAKADDKKKIAKEAKDEACETRFGGKILCVRPFGVGY